MIYLKMPDGKEYDIDTQRPYGLIVKLKQSIQKYWRNIDWVKADDTWA